MINREKSCHNDSNGNGKTTHMSLDPIGIIHLRSRTIFGTRARVRAIVMSVRLKLASSITGADIRWLLSNTTALDNLVISPTWTLEHFEGTLQLCTLKEDVVHDDRSILHIIPAIENHKRDVASSRPRALHRQVRSP